MVGETTTRETVAVGSHQGHQKFHQHWKPRLLPARHLRNPPLVLLLDAELGEREPNTPYYCNIHDQIGEASEIPASDQTPFQSSQRDRMELPADSEKTLKSVINFPIAS